MQTSTRVEQVDYRNFYAWTGSSWVSVYASSIDEAKQLVHDYHGSQYEVVDHREFLRQTETFDGMTYLG